METNLTYSRLLGTRQIEVYRGIDMIEINENYMKRCYELAISAGRKGFDTFGAVLVCDGKILEEAENTADFEKKIFGHAEFNLVHKCANKYTDDILEKSVVYTSCAPCERCLAAIASLGVHQVVCGVSYKESGLQSGFFVAKKKGVVLWRMKMTTNYNTQSRFRWRSL